MAISSALAGSVGAVPVGSVTAFAGSSAPSGWLLCYGQAVDRTQYSGLFAVISTTYGAGDGSTTFNVPDMRGRVAAGADNMGGTDAGRLSVANTLGTTTGAETVTISSANLPTHTHTINHNHGAESFASGNESANHTHQETSVYLYTGNVDYGNYYYGYYPTGATTSGVSANHTHTTTVDLSNFTGDSGNGGFANTAVDKMQPTIILNYIIRT